MKLHNRTFGTRSAECGRFPAKRKHESQLEYADIFKKVPYLKKALYGLQIG